MSDESVRAGKQGQRKLALAPMLFVLLRIWGTIRFFIYCSTNGPISNEVVDDILVILHVCEISYI